MKLLDGVNHITFVTADLDRLIAFYGRVFDAQVTLDLREESIRHAFIQVGQNTVFLIMRIGHASCTRMRPG